MAQSIVDLDYMRQAIARGPGVNQPGAAGNVGRDPGVNQPGRAGNRLGVRR